MKIKMSHNKKRNTAFLYEALVRYVTKCVLEEQQGQKEQAYYLIKGFFAKGSVLNEELNLFKSVLSCSKGSASPKIVERVLTEAKRRYDKLDKKEIFSEQSKLIRVLNRKYGKGFYDCYIPNYKDIATISAIFNDSVPVKTKILLEQNLIKSLVESSPQEQGHELAGSNILMKSFIKKFNDKYEYLHEEQKCLLNAFILSLSDDGLSMRAFLNEELGRLQQVIAESEELGEIKTDSAMAANTKRVLLLFEDFKKKPVDSDALEQILKIQNLAREVQE
jgi:hypothetical protein